MEIAHLKAKDCYGIAIKYCTTVFVLRLVTVSAHEMKITQFNACKCRHVLEPLQLV